MSKLNEYIDYLYCEERSSNTIEKYVRDMKAMLKFVNGQELSKQLLLEWKEYLIQNYAPASVNSMLAAINNYLEWSGLSQFKLKPLKIQRAIFIKPERELTRKEYTRLIKAAEKSDNHRLSLLLQTICSTGIRISELKFITVNAIKTGQALVSCKGKNRTVFLPNELCRLLNRYCRQRKIVKGPVFCTKCGNPINRSNIWRDMKALCDSAGVEREKVFPHNLRHLFARTYYQIEKDLSRLADILGHSSVTTTRIYMAESGHEHIRQLEKMNLIFSRTD